MKSFLLASALVVGLVGLAVTGIDLARAVDCGSPPGVICAWHASPTSIQALSSGLFADDVTWDWYVPGNHSDTGMVIVSWDYLDPDDVNVQAVQLDPALVVADDSLCSDTLTSTLSGDLISTASNGVVSIRGDVIHHTTEVCGQDKNITVLKP